MGLEPVGEVLQRVGEGEFDARVGVGAAVDLFAPDGERGCLLGDLRQVEGVGAQVSERVRVAVAQRLDCN